MRASLDSGCLVLTAGAGCGKTIAVLERARALWAGEPLPEERYSDWRRRTGRP